MGKALNEIGSELFRCHNECEAYELIFDHLTRYYSANVHIIEENDRLKKKGFELKEYLEDYRRKIKGNKKKIELI